MSNTRQVILIAGAPASGKTFLLKRIFRGLCPSLCTQLGVKNLSAWQRTSLRNLSKAQDADFDKLIIHCDLYNSGVLDRVEKILRRADRVTILTLCVSSAELVARNKKRITNNIQDLLHSPMEFRRIIRKISSLWRRQTRNKDTCSLLTLYNNWFDLLTRYQAMTYWMDSTLAVNDPVAHMYGDDRYEALQTVRGNGPADYGIKRLACFCMEAFRPVLNRVFPIRSEVRKFSRQRTTRVKKMLPMVTSTPFNQEAKLIYLHVPKTAGKSFAALCEQNYPGLTSVPANGRYNEEEWARARVVGGHFYYSCFSSAHSRHVFLGVVRNPVERALSRFRWYAHQPGGKASREERGFDHESLFNTLANGHFREEFLHNVQCAFLTDCVRFPDALKVLHSRPFIVGTFDGLDQWVDLIADKFGWAHRSLPMVNNLTHPIVEEDNEELLALLHKYNRQDQQLYEFVLKQGVFCSLPAEYDRKVFLPPGLKA